MKNLKTYEVTMESTYTINGVKRHYKYYGDFNSIEQATKEAFKKYGSDNVLKVQEV